MFEMNIYVMRIEKYGFIAVNRGKGNEMMDKEKNPCGLQRGCKMSMIILAIGNGQNDHHQQREEEKRVLCGQVLPEYRSSGKNFK
ncbi:hypothetical protein DERP_004169 [Dermatophagoides pteronyssinus]|uniref:Uncharacterized protein n=1 Tax=Dermatophagoides pteronyssinus TaxID=6956 RepID=A0ABQ8J8E6_DERPT|nr:hypothetical protein DERP_004169 [Dermatophagoides pteronyssinus]